MNDTLEISTDRARLDVDLIHDFLSRSSYWAAGRQRDIVERTIANSLCFGAYVHSQQVGFGRVITDGAVFGYVADVFVIPDARRRGIGTALMRAVMNHPDVSKLKVVLLRTSDARSFYAKYGFAALPAPEEMMGRYLE
jgi:GNAT superfamily N-acetyltransferase